MAERSNLEEAFHWIAAQSGTSRPAWERDNLADDLTRLFEIADELQEKLDQAHGRLQQSRFRQLVVLLSSVAVLVTTLVFALTESSDTSVVGPMVVVGTPRTVYSLLFAVILQRRVGRIA